MNALLTQFVAESRDLIETASKALLDLEQNANDKDQIDQLFRAVHTIKGASGLFEFQPLTKTVHAGAQPMQLFTATAEAQSAPQVNFNLGAPSTESATGGNAAPVTPGATPPAQ